jgi:hypothetical protein
VSLNSPLMVQEIRHDFLVALPWARETKEDLAFDLWYAYIIRSLYVRPMYV